MCFQNFPSALSRQTKKTNPQQRQNGNAIGTNTITGVLENVQFEKMSIVWSTLSTFLELYGTVFSGDVLNPIIEHIQIFKSLF